MFRSNYFSKINSSCSKWTKFLNVSHCDAEEPSVVEQVAANISAEKAKIKTPMQYDSLKYVLSQSSFDAYDGFRLVVQKQINANTVVAHTYWLGSAATGPEPFYKYRFILPFDEKFLSVQTDLDFNIEGEYKAPLAVNTQGKLSFVLSDTQNIWNLEVEHHDESSATQFQATKSEENSFSFGYMQSITPQLILGGSGQYFPRNQSVQRSIGGLYNFGNNTIGAQWDKNIRLLYLRKVNPNRVHLTTDLVFDEENGSQMTLAAEYTLKQGKLHFSVDSNLTLKSAVDTTVAPGVIMQFTADVAQPKGSYRFGYGLIMG